MTDQKGMSTRQERHSRTLRIITPIVCSTWNGGLGLAAQRLLPELGTVALNYKSGWPSEQSAAESMAARLPRDRALGYTSVGPHRADSNLSLECAPEREQFSRGQAKNACLAAVFGTLACYHALSGETPV